MLILSSEHAIIMKQTIDFLKQKQFYLGIVRYLLGLAMFPYAITKILKIQFAVSGFAVTQARTIESLTGKQLTWAFLGYSGTFQILLGFLELIPALLLLFRRTTLLGAILMLPVTVSVFLINYSFELWNGTKFISTILLTLNLLVFILNWTRVKTVLFFVLSKGQRNNFIKVEQITNIILILAVGYFSLNPLLEYKKQTNILTGDWVNNHPVEWVLQKESLNDSTLVKRNLKLYFGQYGNVNEIGDNEDIAPISYSINTGGSKLDLKYANGTVVKCTYEPIGESGLKIVRDYYSGNNNKLIQYYKKRVVNSERN
jgi:hypothetical protein